MKEGDTLRSVIEMNDQAIDIIHKQEAEIKKLVGLQDTYKELVDKLTQLNQLNSMPSEIEWQRAGLLAVLSQFATNPNVDIATTLSIREATLAILNDHPIGDAIEIEARMIMKQ